MKRLSLFFIVFALLLTACGGHPSTVADNTSSNATTIINGNDAIKTSSTPENSEVNSSSPEPTSSVPTSVEVSQKPVLSLEQIIARSYKAVQPPVEESDVVIEAQTESKVLMSGGAYLFTYNCSTERTNLISDSVLSYKRPIEDELFFTDWNHTEYMVDWRNDDSVTATGNKVIAYHGPQDLVVLEDLEDDFLEIQKSWRNGEKSTQFNYIIESFFGLICINSTANIISDIHLPRAYQYNQNIMDPSINSCFVIEDNAVRLYYLGDILKEIKLPEGTWELMRGSYSATGKAQDNWLFDNVSSKDFQASITKLDVFLINVDEGIMYYLNQDGTLEALINNIVDFGHGTTEFCWMDTRNNVYRYNFINGENKLIGQNAIGICKINSHAGSRGFLVHPASGQDYCLINGYPVAIQRSE